MVNPSLAPNGEVLESAEKSCQDTQILTFYNGCVIHHKNVMKHGANGCVFHNWVLEVLVMQTFTLTGGFGEL